MRLNDPIIFFVDGIPKTAGSKRGFYIPKLKRVIITDDAGKKGKDWRTDVQHAAKASYQGDPLVGPLSLEVEFHMPRPGGHFGSGKNAAILKPTAPTLHTSKPDATKMLRAIEDALTGILWRDDAQIADQAVRKRYATKPGALVTLRMLPCQ